MALRDVIRSIIPQAVLRWYRNRQKEKVRVQLEKQRRSGTGFSQEELEKQLDKMGIRPGDVLLVHSSLSKMGYIEGGPETVVHALIDKVGETGHVLMPTSPNAGLQLEYVQKLGCFDIRFSPSKLGAISETFRQLPKVRRSGSVTEPVSCFGPDAEWFTKDHIDQQTPYNEHSPFYKVAARKGKILYVGCTFDNAGTSLHLLEDAIAEFKFPVYYPELFEVKVRHEDSNLSTHQIKVHNPEMSIKRRCDELIPLFEKHGVLKHTVFGNAPTLLVDAAGMLKVMIDEYVKNGVTMYTPQGSK